MRCTCPIRRARRAHPAARLRVEWTRDGERLSVPYRGAVDDTAIERFLERQHLDNPGLQSQFATDWLPRPPGRASVVDAWSGQVVHEYGTPFHGYRRRR